MLLSTYRMCNCFLYFMIWSKL